MLIKEILDGLWGPLSVFSGQNVFFSLWSKANHLPPSSKEVKNEWSYTSIPLICLYDVTGPTSLTFPSFLTKNQHEARDLKLLF
jgi:hypothetical protein